MGRLYDKDLIQNVIIRIKKLREERGISLQEFYDDTGIHLARIESDKRDLTLSTLKRICDYFEISLVEFFRGI